MLHSAGLLDEETCCQHRTAEMRSSDSRAGYSRPSEVDVLGEKNLERVRHRCGSVGVFPGAATGWLEGWESAHSALGARAA